jgi:hypothetical protein
MIYDKTTHCYVISHGGFLGLEKQEPYYESKFMFNYGLFML